MCNIVFVAAFTVRMCGVTRNLRQAREREIRDRHAVAGSIEVPQRERMALRKDM